MDRFCLLPQGTFTVLNQDLTAIKAEIDAKFEQLKKDEASIEKNEKQQAQLTLQPPNLRSLPAEGRGKEV